MASAAPAFSSTPSRLAAPPSAQTPLRNPPAAGPAPDAPLAPRFPAPFDQEFASIESTVAATERGRWFLGEYARRVRARDCAPLIAALERIEKRLAEGVDLHALAQAQGGHGAHGLAALAGLQAALRLPEDFVARVNAPKGASAAPLAAPARVAPPGGAMAKRRSVMDPPPSFLPSQTRDASPQKPAVAPRVAPSRETGPAPAPASASPASASPACEDDLRIEEAIAEIAAMAAEVAAARPPQPILRWSEPPQRRSPSSQDVAQDPARAVAQEVGAPAPARNRPAAPSLPEAPRGEG